MGRKGAVEKSRKAAANVQRQKRAQRTEKARTDRRGVDENASRKLARVVKRRPEPNEEQRKLLSKQMGLAAIVPGASNDLCTLLRAVVGRNQPIAVAASKAEAGKKRARDDDEEQAQDDTVDDSTVPIVIREDAADVLTDAVEGLSSKLADIVCDELGARVVTTLISSLAAFHKANAAGAASTVPEPSAVVEALLNLEAIAANGAAGAGDDDDEEAVAIEVDERDADYIEPTIRPKLDVLSLAQHHSARSVVWAMIEHGTKKQQKKIAEALLPIASELAVHRHGSIALLRLLEAGEKNAKILAASLMPIIPTLVADPVGYNVAAALINDGNKIHVFDALGDSSRAVKTLNQEKRGSRFLVKLLSVSEGAKDEALSMVGTVAERIAAPLTNDLETMASDRQGNFLFQALFKAAVAAGNVPLQRKLYGAVSKNLLDYCKDKIAVHVVLCFAKHGDAKAIKQPMLGILRSSLVDLVAHQQGSLVVRTLIQSSGGNESVYGMLEQHIDGLMQDPHGNIVVQELLKVMTSAQRNGFIAKHVKKNLLALCQHKFAAHVIHGLLDVVDASAHNELSTMLRPHVITLTQHVSGRFIVEKLVAQFKEVRDQLLSNYISLAQMQGTHHVLCQVFLNSDQKTKQKLVSTVIMPSLKDFCCNKCASVLIQKIIQAEQGLPKEKRVLVPELIRVFTAQRGLPQTLSHDFFGRFVVELINNFQE